MACVLAGNHASENGHRNRNVETAALLGAGNPPRGWRRAGGGAVVARRMPAKRENASSGARSVVDAFNGPYGLRNFLVASRGRVGCLRGGISGIRACRMSALAVRVVV